MKAFRALELYVDIKDRSIIRPYDDEYTYQLGIINLTKFQQILPDHKITDMERDYINDNGASIREIVGMGNANHILEYIYKKRKAKVEIYNKIIRDINQFRKDPTNSKNLTIAVYVEPHKRKVDENGDKKDIKEIEIK